MTELANQRCQKCDKMNQPGVVIGRISGMWLCGECIIKLQKKVDKLKEKLVFEE